jgi:hypothetical protein
MDFPHYKTSKVADLVPYARNSRTHSPQQVDKIAASIREFGFLNPVIVDGENGIIAGHGRIMAAQKLGIEEVPVIEASHLTETQKRAYIIADNRLALDAGWDDEMLRVEFDALAEAGFDLELTGFGLDEIDAFGDDKNITEGNLYTQKVDAPVYEPIGEKPAIEELYNDEKAMGLIEDIKQSNIPEKEKNMLMAAASRHIVFDFGKIANYYAHSNAECQQLMEDSAMVIIDFDKAIAQGYVKLNDELAEIFTQEGKDEQCE